VRESVQYSHLSSLNGLRRILNLGQILPVPKDGVVTPVHFLVKKRNLPGILKDADLAESGTRELSGEWVVSRRIWRRMQREHAVAQSRSHSSTTSPNTARRQHSTGRDPLSSPSSSSRPKESRRSSGTHSTLRSTKARSNSNSQSHPSQSSGAGNPNNRDKVILYLHGGAYYVMSAATHRYITISVSKYTNCRVFAVNYRLAPECRWPGQIHDAVSAYLRLVEELNIPPEMIIFAGDSAGGGLALATLMYLRDYGFPLPCGAIVMSPWVDLTMSCDSWETNAVGLPVGLHLF
jgi:acetyl esterase/lipase